MEIFMELQQINFKTGCFIDRSTWDVKKKFVQKVHESLCHISPTVITGTGTGQ